MVAAAFAALGLQLTSWSVAPAGRCQAKQAANISSAKAGHNPAQAEEIVLANAERVVMANEMKPSNNKLSSRTQYELSSRTQCGDLGFCHYERSEVIQKSSVACEEIASTTPQMWLVAGSHLGFAENLFKLRNDKNRGQV